MISDGSKSRDRRAPAAPASAGVGRGHVARARHGSSCASCGGRRRGRCPPARRAGRPPWRPARPARSASAGGRSPAGPGKPTWAPTSTPRAERRAHGAVHDQRVAGVEAAGDVGRRDDAEQGLVVAHAPGARSLRRDPHSDRCPWLGSSGVSAFETRQRVAEADRRAIVAPAPRPRRPSRGAITGSRSGPIRSRPSGLPGRHRLADGRQRLRRAAGARAGRRRQPDDGGARSCRVVGPSAAGRRRGAAADAAAAGRRSGPCSSSTPMSVAGQPAPRCSRDGSTVFVIGRCSARRDAAPPAARPSASHGGLRRAPPAPRPRSSR